jgi:hypothetical protein
MKHNQPNLFIREKIMQTVQIKDLPKGEFFKRKPDASKVYQRKDYNRQAKKYDCRDMLDCWGNGLQLKGTTVVFIGFDY